MGSDSNTGRYYRLEDYHKGSALSSLTDVFSDRLEQTVGGATIGVARDLWSKPQSHQEQVERAQSNDMAAEIVGDTAAIIPKFGTLTAGTLRAGLLVNPHKSFADNSGSFLANMAEGAALNRVGKLMTPASGLQSALLNNVASPLKREVATHLTMGAGFGAVKSGFDSRTWLDDKGNFVPGSGALNVLKASTVGAGLNVPAGMVGLRVMKSSMSLMVEKQISRPVATTLAAAGSGYTSGAMIGGIDAVTHGKSLSETLDHMHFSGKIGLATGSIVGALDRGPLTSNLRDIVMSPKKANAVSSQEQAPGESLLRAAKASDAKASSTKTAFDVLEPQPSKAGDGRPSRRATRNEIKADEIEAIGERESRKIFEELDYRPRVDYRVTDVLPRLKNPRVETETVRVLKPNAKQTFDSFEDFIAQTEAKPVRMRIYDVEGHKAQLGVEESLALTMDKARNDRLALEYIANKKVAYDDLPHQARREIGLEWNVRQDHEALLTPYLGAEGARESVSVVRARMHLMQNKHAVALPEDFVVMLDELPNRTKIRRLDLYAGKNTSDVWHAQKFNEPGFSSAATASPDGVISFYMPEGSRTLRPALREFMRHEFGHITANNAPEEAAIYELAAFVDKDIPNPNYAPKRTVDGAAAAGGNASDAVPQLRAPGADRGKVTFESWAKESSTNPNRETKKYFARSYAMKNADEDGAVHLGEEMLSPESTRFFAMAENAPVRTVVLSKSLIKVMSSARGSDQSVHANQLWQRMRYVETDVYPEAIKVLEKRIKSGTPTEQAAAAELLGHLGNAERHLPMLRKMASNEELASLIPDGTNLAGKSYEGAKLASGTLNGERRSAVFQPRTQERSVAEVAFDAMLKLQEGSAFDQFHFLTREVMTKSPLEQMAINKLRASKDLSASSYLKLAQSAGDARRIPDLLDLMRSLPDQRGKEMALVEALNLGSGSPEFLRSAISKALEVPGLAHKALEYVRPEESMHFQRELHRLTRQSWDAQSRDKARQLVRDMPHEIDVSRAVELMRSDNPRGVQQGIDLVIQSRTPDKRVIEPLLEVVANGPDANARAARQALMRFNGQVVKFHAHQVKQRGFKVDLNWLFSGRG